MTKSYKGSFEFSSPINKENSFTGWKIADNAKSIIEIEINENGEGYFDWDIPELEEGAYGELRFEDNELVDYDGVFELPSQLIEYLEQQGYNCDFAKV